MKYTFNQHVTFDVAERKLISEDVVFMLTNPACRLLLVLIGKNGELVEKEYLLNKVWEEFGLASSEGSLYNNISLLRKGLVKVGITNGLETVPKKGVRLTLDSIDLEHITSSEVISNQALTPSPPYVKRGWRSRRYKFGIIVLSYLLVLSILAILLHNYISAYTQHYKSYGNVGKCAIYYFDDVRAERVERFFSGPRGKSILKLCTVPAVVYYDDNNIDTNTEDASIVSLCDLQDGDVHECKNFVSVNTN
ncbi:TPA: DNA-binding protein [Klebsiella quasipneumoniae subsp. similipneumoniae]|nr:DNA-binding protein [Klebsiella quasipneumoniae subsp. similipneumoniae]